MSNTEPDVGGTQNMFRSLFQRNTTVNAMAGSEIKIAGLEEATRQMAGLNAELKGLVTSLTGLSQQQTALTQGISATMKTISTQAQQTTQAVSATTESVSRFRSGAMSIAGVLGSAVNSNFVKDLAMFPLRYITSATEQARNVGMGVSTSLGGQMYATGQTQGALMEQLSRFPGQVRGGVEDIIGLQSVLRQYGAMADLSRPAQYNPRTVGFLKGVSEMQAMEPGAQVTQLAQTIGSYAANTSAQQQSAYLTGGAFSMIASGGRQKSVSEWAESILKWLEGQRPGEQRGKGFNYGELMAQYFPGSNIDAWFTAQGVPEGMKEAFWNYALAKSRITGSTSVSSVGPQGGGAPTPFTVQPATQGGNQAWGRLNAATAQSRGQFKMGGALSGMFSNKETANQWFNEIISQVMSEIIPAQIAGGSLQAMGVMPDPIQELLMTFLERSGTMGAAIGGYIGYGASGLSNLTSGMIQQLFGSGLPSGALGTSAETNMMLGGFGANPNAGSLSDLMSAATAGSTQAGWTLPSWASDLFGPTGDIGDAWTSQGTGSTAGLHPTVRGGIDRMIGDNPRIKVTSGLRDTVQQRRLRAAGNNRVSGKPSAHTRGLAADLGPRSEYGWISANASKYGLKSGVSHGEPWHVGLPGVGDIGDDEATGIGSLFGMFKEGFTKDDAVAGLGKLVPGLLNLFLGAFGTTVGAGAASNLSSIGYDPGLYAALRKAAGGAEGIISFGGSFTNRYVPTSTGTDPADLVAATSNNYGGLETWETTGTTVAGSQQAGVAAAKALFNAGFTKRDELEKIVAIAWRESKWKPTAANDNGEDKGLMQINRKAWASTISGMGYTAGDLLDLQKNANVAHRIYQMSGNSYSAWNFSKNSMYWGAPARPGWERPGTPGSSPFVGTEGSNAASIVSSANIPNLGDLDTAAYSLDPTTYAPIASSGDERRAILFNNTFNISGGGGQGGIDVRRTVAMLADQLEGEMKKRLSRTN